MSRNASKSTITCPFMGKHHDLGRVHPALQKKKSVPMFLAPANLLTETQVGLFKQALINEQGAKYEDQEGVFSQTFQLFLFTCF